MNELLLIKDKVTEEHKLVDEWTGRQICKLFSNISKTIHALLPSRRCLIDLQKTPFMPPTNALLKSN